MSTHPPITTREEAMAFAREQAQEQYGTLPTVAENAQRFVHEDPEYALIVAAPACELDEVPVLESPDLLILQCMATLPRSAYIDGVKIPKGIL